MGNRDEELHMAVRKGDRSAVESLLSSGANIDCLFYGWTPLQLAIDIGNQEMAILLIDSGGNIEFHDKNSLAPFEEAVLKKQARVVDALLKKGATGDIIMKNGETALTYAVKKDSFDMLKVLIDVGVDADRYNNYGHTALYLAAKKGECQMVRSLLTAGASINNSCKAEGDCTPLIVAAANEHLNVVSLLVKQQACDLNYQDKDGWSALWHAYSNSNDEICSILLRAGADKNQPNGDGLTIIQDARNNEEEVMLEVFQKYNNMM